MVVQLQPALQLTDDQFHEICRCNRELRIERTAEGGLSIMSPTGWDTGNRNAEITYQLRRWARGDGTGQSVDSSTGYRLPNGAIRSPDASWISNERLAGVPADERAKYLPQCPDFVVELRSPSDNLAVLQDKMAEYMANGAVLGWLIDPVHRRVFVYRPGVEAERLDEPAKVSGGAILDGFVLDMREVW